MIRPVENQDRSQTGEYVNRVKQTDPGHGPSPRDFAYAVEEASREQQKKRRHEPSFGEDTYESAEKNEPPVETAPARNPEESSSDDGNLDITV